MVRVKFSDLKLRIGVNYKIGLENIAYPKIFNVNIFCPPWQTIEDTVCQACEDKKHVHSRERQILSTTP